MLSQDTPVADLVYFTIYRLIIERGYQELRKELGPRSSGFRRRYLLLRALFLA